MSYVVDALKEIPDIISPEDRSKLEDAENLGLQARFSLYQELVGRYSDCPYILAQYADFLIILGAGALALNQYRNAQSILSSQGIIDDTLDSKTEHATLKYEIQAQKDLDIARQNVYYQKWKPTNQHIFPTNMPQLPLGSQELKEQWQALVPPGQDSPFLGAYMMKLAIETNHVESTFLLTEDSARDLIQRGISEGVVAYRPESSLHDCDKIKGILKDTLSAYALIPELCDKVQSIDRGEICRVHASIMKTCQFATDHYIPIGKTRTETRKTVIVGGAYKVECCPFPEVDGELEYICRMAKQWIKTWRNPFATASWVHLILVRCHPFEDGNGRLVRLLASVPVFQNGYPPISIGLVQRPEYFAAINKAYEGDHSALIHCIVQGMKETIESVQITLGQSVPISA